jgi:signal transduction histidine kinase
MNGIGLGLVISKMIVSQFDGTIDFISKYEKGSSFYFTFKLEYFENKDRIYQY